MARRCATLTEFLDQVPECRTFGDTSRGTVTFNDQPGAGSKVTITDDFTFPSVVGALVAVAGAPAANEYQIGANTTETAANFVTAANLATNAINALVMAESTGAVVTLGTAAEGPNSMFLMDSDDVNVVVSGTRMEDGDDMVRHALDCACLAINLDCWRDKASCAHIYLTAHLCSVANGEERGLLTAKTIDKISVSFGNVMAKEAGEFSSTKWGRLFEAMRSTLLVMPLVGRTNLLRPQG